MFLTICIAASLLPGGSFPSDGEQLVNQVEEQCSVKNKDGYHKEFLANYGVNDGDQEKALRAAKKYVACSAGSRDEEDRLANLNLALGRMLRLKNLHAQAIPYLIKAASYNSMVQVSAKTYSELADSYEQGPYAEQLEPYKAKFAGKDETDESKLALENINQVIDRMIDANARAVALADDQHGKTEWMDTLRTFYRFRHNGSDAGLQELMRTVLYRPLLPLPTPITSLPPKDKN